MRRLTTSLAFATALCCSALGAPSAFATAPTISLTTFSSVTTSSVMLEAEINPQGAKTTYHFEYGPADCSASPCTSAPFPDGTIAKGAVAVRKAVEAKGLEAGTTYHFRVVAKNSEPTEGPDKTFTTYTPAPVFGPCSNDPLRIGAPSAALPDCRAYEQASPVDKNGLDASGSDPTVRASVNGDRISFAASNGVPGGQGAQEIPLYLASRGAGGWSTQGILPPESSGQKARILGWTPDFSDVFSRSQTFNENPTATFLARSSVDGSLTPIVPSTTAELTPSFAGASADGSKVFFEATGAQLTAKAAAGKNNLYVWDRATETISLVGALNEGDGEAPPGGSFAGPYDWVQGTTATSLANGGAQSAYYTQEEHAISTDGSRAYFTAGKTGELYLRENPTQPQSALDGGGNCTEPSLGCTIHVSASEKTNGKSPDGTDAAGARPAAFMAASADGSRAFFTSSEKLTNDATTGPEPPPAAIARAGIGGAPVEPSFLPAHATGVAVDGSHIYWADPEAGAIGRAELGGGNPEAEFIGGIGKPKDVAVDAEHIYWTNPGSGAAGEGTIGRAKLGAGGAEEIEAEFIKGADDPQGIAVDSSHIYWVNAGLKPEGFVARANLDGTAAEPEFIHFATGDVVVNASKIYFSRTNGTDGFIREANLDGSKSENLVTVTGAGGSPEGLALDGSHLYWTNPATSAIGRSSLTGASVEQSFITGAGHPQGLAVDAEHLYWAANQGAPPNPGNDLYRYDTATSPHKLTDLSVDHTVTDTDGAQVRGVLGVSKDGSDVYFVANGVLTNTPNAAGESAAAGNCQETIGPGTGTCNLYLSAEGAISFIVRLEEGGSEGTSDAANWTGAPLGFASAARFQKTARVSADGQTLLFRSQGQLSGYDNEGKPELYRYHVGAAGLTCVSCNPTGAPPVSALPNSILTPVLRTANPASTLSRSLSADGDRVFFESTDPLVGADTNSEGGCPIVGSDLQSFPACQDVYEWEADGAGSCRSEAQNGGCLYLLSSGKSPDPSFFADASPSGKDVFLLTRSQLVGQDQDQLVDVYDAREEGGLASQNEMQKTPCENEGCKPAATPPPGFQSPGSASLIGPANPEPSRHKKPHHKKKGQTKKQKHRKAKTTGRASR
jgi:hypothetical protein